MPEIIRTRDCTVHFKGDAYPVSVSSIMLQNGWGGCQGVQWADSPTDEFVVTYSDGLYGGFLLWGSNEPADAWTALSGNQLKYGFAILCAGGWLTSTSNYEKYTWESRQVGPLVPNNYVVGKRLTWSLRGLLTCQNEWFLSGDPRGSNTYYVAYVIQKPRPSNNWNLVVQTAI